MYILVKIILLYIVIQFTKQSELNKAIKWGLLFSIIFPFIDLFLADWPLAIFFTSFIFYPMAVAGLIWGAICLEEKKQILFCLVCVALILHGILLILEKLFLAIWPSAIGF